MTENRLSFISLESPAVMSQVIDAVVGVLRAQVRDTWIDAVSDRAWPEDRKQDVAALLALEKHEVEAGKRRKRSGLGIRLDLSNDHHFGLLVRLAPYSNSAEAWSTSGELFSVHDSGDHAWFSLTPVEAGQAADRLVAVGLAFEDVLSYRG